MNDELKEYLQTGKKNLILIYVLYLCGIVAPVFPLIGVVIAYINKDTKDAFLSSHYIFIFRTFFIGFTALLFFYLPFLMIVGWLFYIILICWFLIRTTVGLKYVSADKPHPNPNTYWIGS